mmetsp:Transcript_105026/g.301953  ORF Transcript_105026/g.301953 Transcript_105026/m.301953 type:complete len:451 (-) Transcript_105026:130-1482(-)
MKSGNGTQAATYSFASQPKAVTATRKKFRDPGEMDISMYRDLKETCISWDKRVHRGNTYGMYTQNAIKEALNDATQEPSPKPRRRKRETEPNIFDMPLPEQERKLVDLTGHLTAKEVVVVADTVDCQTDEFLPEPPKGQYQTQKTGIDATTQVEDGELFDFDYEVEPILDVLVNKTLEQSMMEVEEEHEMSSMKTFKESWFDQQRHMMKNWQAQVDEECALWQLKEKKVAERRLVREREARVLLKIQAVSSAKQHLGRLVPNAVAELNDVAFPDAKSVGVDQLFVPQLLAGIQQQIVGLLAAQQTADALVAGCFQGRASAHSEAYAAQRARQKESERKRFEEMQIRQGRIRILVDDGEGGQTPVGPIQISSQDGVPDVEDRIHSWIREHRPALASAWSHGVELRLGEVPVASTLAIFEAKAGQLSVVPRPAPPPAEDEEDDEGGEEGDDA